MKRVRYNKVPRCIHGHLLVPGNLTKRGECRTCNIMACERYLARKRTKEDLGTQINRVIAENDRLRQLALDLTLEIARLRGEPETVPAGQGRLFS